MKILIVNTRHYYGGGDSTYTFNLASLLKDHEHDVSFFAMQDVRNLPDPNSDLFANPIDFRSLNQSKSLANGWIVLHRSIYSREARAKFARLIDRVKPDIIHAQNLHGHLTPSILMEARARGLPVVWTLHDYKLVCPNSHFLIDSSGVICEACRGGRYYQAVLKRCKKNSLLASLMASLEAYIHQLMGIRELADLFLAPSAFLRNKLIENGFPTEKVVHLPLFLPEEKFEYIRRDEGYFLFLGKIDPIKGIKVLTDAARRTPEVRVLLAGREEDKQTSNLLANLPSNTRYLGMKSGKELKDLLRGALALVLPSLWYENQPFVILEAFAAGKPVIASRLGGMEELVVHQERGILTEDGNIDQLANAMKVMQKDPVLCKKMGINGFNYVRIVHSPMHHYDQLIAIYSQLINKE
jgi:glycosyltransferase involved in cell wall biosynthesis